MELLNASKLLAAYTQGLAPDGRESLVVVAKGTFNLPLDGRAATLADSQQPLLMADTFLGEPGLSAPLQEMDFAPIKPFCDVLVRGKASITLTREGKVLIRGTYLSSRSSGVNRIKGGSVQIN